jgi:CO/xanthine dehydrogenase Mo-binding subunit
MSRIQTDLPQADLPPEGGSHGVSRHGVSRRELLKSTAALIVGFTFDRALPLGAAQRASGDAAKPVDLNEVDSYLAIHRDGRVTIYTSKVDVGTGMRIAIAQMAAEELGVAIERIALVDGDTLLCPNQGGTGGSTGLTRGGTGVRRAAATARQGLLTLAAAQLKRPIDTLRIQDGVVRPLAGGRGVAIGTLVGGRRLSLQVDANAPLAPPSGYRTVGRPIARPDVPAKCTGRHVYVHDVRVPGMLHARVLRPPQLGARLIDVDESSIQGIPDARVVRIESFLAVVAKDEWASVRAAAALKANWTESRLLPDHATLDQYVRKGPVEREQTVVNKGDVEGELGSAARSLSATYFWPNQSHGSLGPSCAVADVRPGGTTIWTSSQVSHGLRANLSRVFGLPLESIRVIFQEGSGSYGTNGADNAAADAVLLSKTINAPVRVQWSRQDELAWDPKGPQQLLELRAGLGAGGRLVAWDTEMWIPANRPGARPLLAADAARIPQEEGRNAAAIQENGDPSYDVPNVRVRAHWRKDTPLVPSNLRAPGKIANVFAVEGFTDEIAAAAGVDPLAFRVSRLNDPRALEALTRATETFGWKPRPSPNPQALQNGLMVGRGLAYIRYKQAENYVATVMEVAVDPSSGTIHVTRVVCAHDCGLVVNPDALKNQIEGAIIQTISRTLHEEVTMDGSRVTSVDWARYPILTFPEVPAVDVILLDRPDLPLLGAGEAATVPVAAALGNAVFDATGVRLRRAPLTPERVKAALTTR